MANNTFVQCSFVRADHTLLVRITLVRADHTCGSHLALTRIYGIRGCLLKRFGIFLRMVLPFLSLLLRDSS